jgi:hypothetical protein
MLHRYSLLDVRRRCRQTRDLFSQVLDRVFHHLQELLPLDIFLLGCFFVLILIFLV